MRLRNKSWAKPLIQAHPEAILVVPTQMPTHWQERFTQTQPLFIEVGSGKGQFILEMARRHPENNYIAVELQESAIAFILREQVQQQLPNLQLLLADGADLTTYFAPNEVSGIFLNFSDPWPKTRHEKRRLTYRHFLEAYRTIMQPAGQLILKTDNQGFFEYSLLSFNQFGCHFDEVSLDLHALADPDNVQTEYEEKFSAKGQRIYRLKLQF